jgi:hypothetical protein
MYWDFSQETVASVLQYNGKEVPPTMRSKCTHPKERGALEVPANTYACSDHSPQPSYGDNDEGTHQVRVS